MDKFVSCTTSENDSLIDMLKKHKEGECQVSTAWESDKVVYADVTHHNLRRSRTEEVKVCQHYLEHE